MKKRLLCFFLALLCLGGLGRAGAVSLSLNGDALPTEARLFDGHTYVPLRAALAQLAPGAEVSWSGTSALVEHGALQLSARPGDLYMEAGGRYFYAARAIKLMEGRVWVPLRALAAAFGYDVRWAAESRSVLLQQNGSPPASEDSFYDPVSLYWLARIIHAEAGSEPLEGKVAVGSVVLNRVESAAFPDSIYAVIFDRNWGLQFEPVGNGSIYNSPSAESILAAKLSLDGAKPVGSCLYFFNPTIAQSSWIAENRPYHSRIGGHLFYL